MAEFLFFAMGALLGVLVLRAVQHLAEVAEVVTSTPERVDAKTSAYVRNGVLYLGR